MPAPTKPARVVPVASLVLCPDYVFNNHSILHSLHVRTGSTVPFEMFPLDEPQIERYYKHFSAGAKELLPRFNDDDVAFEISQLRKKHAKEKSHIPLEKYLAKTVTRYQADLLLQLLEAQPDLRLYHRIQNKAHGNYLTSKCTLHAENPVLHFEIVKNEQGCLQAKPMVSIQGRHIPLADFRRYRFLIADAEHRYYMLKQTDYLTLDWLEASTQEQYGQNVVQFMQRIVLKLEEGHKVVRNNHFAKKEIAAEAANCLYLSEIGDSMLMLTPRWQYEGITVDGPWKAQHETIRNGEAYTVLRQKEAEDAFVQYLQQLHPSFAKQQQTFFYISFAEAKKKQWFLKVWHQLLEQNVTIIGLELLRHFRYSPYKPTTDISILHQEGEKVQLKLTVKFDKELIKLSELQKLLLAGQNSLLLKDSSIALFDDEWLEQYAAIIKHGKLKEQTLTVPSWIMLSLSEGSAQRALQPALPQQWQQKWLQWQQAEAAILPMPNLLRATLRPYQQKGFEWLSLLAEIGAGACLADDMGLGKTLQTITFISHRAERNPQARFLITCPASLIFNWQQELARFAPELKVLVHNGTQRNFAEFINGSYQIIITTYGTLRSDIESICVPDWDTVVVDESQNIKNIGALTTKAVMRLKATARVCLSGTPVMNNTFDLYAQLNWLLPGLMGGQEFFRKEYAQPIDRDADNDKMKALQQLTAPFILRRTKAQVATDLPEKTESILWCQMKEEQQLVYEQIREQIKGSVFLGIQSNGLERNKLDILQGIMKLRQVCGSPQLLDESNTKEAVKIETLLHELSQLNGHKALVFSQFKGMLNLVAASCSERGIPYYHFDGDTPVAKRQELVAAFQQPDDTTPVFLISLKSGNAGLNLTAADYVFLLDPWWNNAVQQQAIDRTHRIGQTRNVFAYKMICKDTIEEKIMALQEKKQFVSEELVAAEDGFVKNLSEDEVAWLFS
ncbi:MAG: DEAD/DEAH box helicase [Edaphocola sp.]